MKQDQLRQGLLETCFERHTGIFAAGQTANNKLDCEKIQNDPILMREVVKRIGPLIFINAPAPDFVVGVPDGANWLAERVAHATKVNPVVLKNNKPEGRMEYADAYSRSVAENGFRGTIIEDVFNRFTNTRRVLELGELREKITAAVGIWDRGDDELREPLVIPHRAVIVEHIPDILPKDAEQWKYAQK